LFLSIYHANNRYWLLCAALALLSVVFIIVILCVVTCVNKNNLEMATLIVSISCPSELSNISALAASDEGQLAVVMNDGVFILVSCKIVLQGLKCKFSFGMYGYMNIFHLNL